MLSTNNSDFEMALRKVDYLSKLRELQIELIKLQNWVVEKNKRILIIFEGGEFSGKGSTINAMMQTLNPRSARLVALPKPTKIEKGQWYFQRYIMQLPKPGEMTFFDRSWYNRAVVEPVNGFCTKKQYKQFMNVVNHFESMIYNDGIIIRKIFLSIKKSEQKKRIAGIKNNLLRRWELSKVDLNAQTNWEKYKTYQQEMFKKTDTEAVPWKIVDSNDTYKSHIESIKYILSSIPRK